MKEAPTLCKGLPTMFCYWSFTFNRLFLRVPLLQIFRAYAEAECFVEQAGIWTPKITVEKWRLHFTEVRIEYNQTAVRDTQFETLLFHEGVFAIRFMFLLWGKKIHHYLMPYRRYSVNRNLILFRMINQLSLNLSVTNIPSLGANSLSYPQEKYGGKLHQYIFERGRRNC